MAEAKGRMVKPWGESRVVGGAITVVLVGPGTRGGRDQWGLSRALPVTLQ